jgi:hypothetical protein
MQKIGDIARKLLAGLAGQRLSSERVDTREIAPRSRKRAWEKPAIRKKPRYVRKHQATRL